MKWVSFHSGYDFGYLLKLLTGGSPLPAEEGEFFRLLHTFFPAIFDVKNMMVHCDSLKGGLNKLADDLDVRTLHRVHLAVLCACVPVCLCACVPVCLCVHVCVW